MFVTEKRLNDGGYLDAHTLPYFSPHTAFGLYGIEDDHKPFMSLGMCTHVCWYGYWACVHVCWYG